MKKIGILFALLTATACGGEIFDTRYDEIAPSGLRVRYANDKPPRIDVIDRMYAEVAECMGIKDVPPGPLVAIEVGLIEHIGRDGMWQWPDFIWADAQITTLDWNDSLAATRGSMRIRHEMVHYLGAIALNFTQHQHDTHDSPFFEACKAPGFGTTWGPGI